MMKFSTIQLAIVIAAVSTSSTTNAFVTPRSNVVAIPTSSFSPSSQTCRLAAAAPETGSETESVFVADDSDNDGGEDKTFEAVEKFGKGAAKTKRGKRKGGEESPSTKKTMATLKPEETFYEGPPAITETIAPTISILTVVGIIPAAAAWARQAWVRYTITNRRIRVTSGVGGKDMAEIVYPDVVEIRTVKRLFGDGDVVFFLRDGAKFEMRNVPNFEESMEFILGQVDKEVVDLYRNKGNVGAN